jgi:hypothetical protein
MRDHGNAAVRNARRREQFAGFGTAPGFLGRRCQGNFKPTIVPATCRVNLQADVLEISFDRPPAAKKIALTKRLRGAHGGVRRHAATGSPPQDYARANRRNAMRRR